MPAYAARAYSYMLPPELIAQKPAARRENSRLLVLHKDTGRRQHKHFYDIPAFLDKNDLLVFNDTRVLPVRLTGRKSTGARCEILLLKRLAADRWECLAKPGRRLSQNSVVEFGADFSAKILDVLPGGRRVAQFSFAGNFLDSLSKHGQTPLPPYVKPSDPDTEALRKFRYQTVYARVPGAAAAPTAGLHFSRNLLTRLKKQGIAAARVTLHTSLGTFQPLKAADIRAHQMHAEEYNFPAETARAVNECRKRGGRVVAVGTTTARVLETVYQAGHPLASRSGETAIYIYPGYKFKLVDALITNFHLPRSTLLLLVSALAGRGKILQAYQEAVKLKYRFFSFGDAMLII
ncbi:MAG: tRNA preQ1(34) S-adenosylmethionine ribosyltransferase-isomerase QueA [Candidatus Margulisbacteria bacterium]|jgi:S-adenosylmethionine:tRNA ribosyltransferase-isomerase|nr:tRNA preQ1(34) S-adenosylmethionine ribosyltransferase-isomerase QueA [Candidatus Margulisiibacteriota bacterium]